jgi:N-acetylglutamate synthase-like GNAT family acetyltransferase
MNIYRRPPFERTVALLCGCGLPTDDISESSLGHFLGCGSPSAPDGVIGLEILGEDGLLRSLAVAEGARGRGRGKALVAALEALARAQGVRHLYLLTESAEVYFGEMGFAAVDRSLVADSIRRTQEYSCLCPDDAVVMRKDLAR